MCVCVCVWKHCRCEFIHKYHFGFSKSTQKAKVASEASERGKSKYARFSIGMEGVGDGIPGINPEKGILIRFSNSVQNEKERESIAVWMALATSRVIALNGRVCCVNVPEVEVLRTRMRMRMMWVATKGYDVVKGGDRVGGLGWMRVGLVCQTGRSNDYTTCWKSLLNTNEKARMMFGLNMRRMSFGSSSIYAFRCGWTNFQLLMWQRRSKTCKRASESFPHIT